MMEVSTCAEACTDQNDGLSGSTLAEQGWSSYLINPIWLYASPPEKPDTRLDM